MLTAAKTAWQFWSNLAGKIIDRKMWIWTLTITLLQILCKTILNYEAIAWSTIVPDDTFLESSLALIG